LPGEHLPGKRVPLSSYLNLSISSYFAVHDEIAYRWSQEVAAMGNILITELITPSDTARHLGTNAYRQIFWMLDQITPNNTT
jgi:hypothetical protein